MSTFIRITPRDGSTSVRDIRDRTCIRVRPGSGIEFLGADRSMVTFEPLRGGIYVAVFPAGGFELEDLHSAYASDDPPTMVFGGENGSGREVSTKKDLDRLLVDRAARGPSIANFLPPIAPRDFNVDLPRPWA